MGWDDDNHKNEYHNVVNAPHKAHLSHEAIAAAASYEAAKAWEKHQAEQGKPSSHAKALEFLAAGSGFFIDRLVETKGLDFISAQKAKHEAQQRISKNLDNHY